VCNFKYKKCLSEIEHKYDPLTKERSMASSLKKSFKVSAEAHNLLTTQLGFKVQVNTRQDGKRAITELSTLAQNEEIEEYKYQNSLNTHDSAFPKNKGLESDYEPHKRQYTEPIADAGNNPFFESENNLDKEENSSLVQQLQTKDESQRDNNDVSYDKESPNLYDVDFYSTSDDELPEEVKHLDVNDALIQDIFLEVLHQFQSNDLESGKTIISSNFLNGIIDITDSRVKESIRSKLNEEQQT
ncbi:721_t:CDS:2, partial [Funneliformis caledonium]